MSGLKQPYDECKNPFISGLRVVADMIGSWFNGKGMARVSKVMKKIDPDFSGGGFEWELGERVVLKVVDAYLSGDQEALEAWRGLAVSPFKSYRELIVVLTCVRTDVQCSLNHNGSGSQVESHQPKGL